MNVLHEDTYYNYKSFIELSKHEIQLCGQKTLNMKETNDDRNMVHELPMPFFLPYNLSLIFLTSGLSQVKMC